MKIEILPSVSQPIYEQIVDQIKAAIISGEQKPGDPLPSIRALARELGISVITTKRAYDELEKEGYLCSVAAKGIFVAEHNSQIIREEHLRQIEAHLLAALKLAPACGLQGEDLVQMLRLFERELP